MNLEQAVIDAIIEDLQTRPPVEWVAAVEALNEDTQREISAILETRGLCALWQSIYVRERADGRTHKQAVKALNGVRTKVRRALGFSYPEAGQFAF